MLNTSYSVGAGAYAFVFTKRFDSENRSLYQVQGRTESTARTMSVQHQQQKNKSNRHLADMTFTYAVPGSTNGATYSDRVYLVVQRSPHTVDADIKGHIATFLALAGNADFQTALLNKES